MKHDAATATAKQRNKTLRGFRQMMGLHNWLRGQHDDVDLTHDEPRLSKEGNFMPIDNGAKFDPTKPPPFPIASSAGEPPKKPLPYHIAPVEKPDEASVVMQAHQFVEQWKIKDATQLEKIEQLESDLKAEKRKSDLFELDVVQHINTIATLQSEVLAQKEEIDRYRNFLAVQKQINEKERLTYERFEIGDLPKKERAPKKAKHPKKALPDGTMPGDKHADKTKTETPS